MMIRLAGTLTAGVRAEFLDFRDRSRGQVGLDDVGTQIDQGRYVWIDVDAATVDPAAVFAALKPGGLYVILDHQAADGAGISVAGTLHRIEAAELRRQVEAAGFIFDGETSAVRVPADDHSLSVFDASIRGRTDRFVYRFRKPG